IAEVRQRGVDVDCMSLPTGVQQLLALVDVTPEMMARPAPRAPWLARVGDAARDVWRSAERALAFLGGAMLAFGQLLLGRARHRRSDLYHEIQEAGARALPIVTLISVLIGMILAFVGGVTLRNFGATIYVADLVAIAQVRELGAIMTAIIMA